MERSQPGILAFFKIYIMSVAPFAALPIHNCSLLPIAPKQMLVQKRMLASQV